MRTGGGREPDGVFEYVYSVGDIKSVISKKAVMHVFRNNAFLFIPSRKALDK